MSEESSEEKSNSDIIPDYSEVQKQRQNQGENDDKTLVSVRGCTEETFKEILEKFDLKTSARERRNHWKRNLQSFGNNKNNKIGGGGESSDELKGANLNLQMFISNEKKLDEQEMQLDKEIEELDALDVRFETTVEKPVYKNEKNFSLLSAPELLATGGSQRLYFHQLAAKEFRKPNFYGEEDSSTCSEDKDDAEIVRDVFAKLQQHDKTDENNNDKQKTLKFDVVTVGKKSSNTLKRRRFHFSKTLLLLWTGVGLVLWVVTYMILRLCYVI